MLKIEPGRHYQKYPCTFLTYVQYRLGYSHLRMEKVHFILESLSALRTKAKGILIADKRRSIEGRRKKEPST